MEYAKRCLSLYKILKVIASFHEKLFFFITVQHESYARIMILRVLEIIRTNNSKNLKYLFFIFT